MTDNSADGLMPFHAMEILKRAQAIEATGRVVCHLDVGEPGAPPAPPAARGLDGSGAVPYKARGPERSSFAAPSSARAPWSRTRISS